MVVQSLEQDMGQFARHSQFIDSDRKSDAQYAALRAEMQSFRDELSRMREDTGGRFGQVDLVLERINRRFDQVDRRFEQVDKRFDRVDQRFEEMAAQMEAMERRIENRLTIKLGTFMAIAIGVTATLVRLIH